MLTAALGQFTGLVHTRHAFSVVDQGVADRAAHRVAVHRRRVTDCRREELNIGFKEWTNS